MQNRYMSNPSSSSTVGPPYLRVPHLQIQPTKGWKYFFLIPESSKKQNLNLPQAGNDLHGF